MEYSLPINFSSALNSVYIPNRKFVQGYVVLGAHLLSAVCMSFNFLFQIIHCDLAARNILIAEKGVLKIGDFGMAREASTVGPLYQNLHTDNVCWGSLMYSPMAFACSA